MSGVPVLSLKGKIRLKSADRMKWLRGPVGPLDAETYTAAGFGASPGDRDAVVGATDETVQALLEALQRDRRARCRFTFARSPIVLEGLVPVALVPIYWPRLVAAATRAAERGGVGEVSLSLASKQAMRVSMTDGEARLAKVNLAAERAAKAPPLRVPGVLDRAPTGRATCKGCRKAIAKGEERFGLMDVARSRPGAFSYRWLHLACAVAAAPFSVGPLLGARREEPALQSAIARLPEGALDAPTPAFFAKGDVVVLPDGRQGEVCWYGPDKYGGGLKVGVNIAGVDKPVYAQAHQVRH